MRRTWVFLRMESKTSTHINQRWKHVDCKAENVVPIVLLGVTVDITSPTRCQCSIRKTDRRQLREIESQMCQTSISHSRKDWTYGESGSSGSAGEHNPPKHLFHTSQRDPRTNTEGEPEGRPVLICARAQKSRIPRATKNWECCHSGSDSSQRKERIATTPSICGRSAKGGYPSYPCKNKTAPDPMRRFAAFPSSSKQA